eukprot:615889-Prorocentrum_minimum.AAC.1
MAAVTMSASIPTMASAKSARMSFKPVKAARSLTKGFTGRAQPLVARSTPKAAGRKMVVETKAYKVCCVSDWNFADHSVLNIDAYDHTTRSGVGADPDHSRHLRNRL